MKIGEIWQDKHIKQVQVIITNIYHSNDVVNPGSVAPDGIYISTKYISPFDDGSSHADLARKHFLDQYVKLYKES